LNGRKNKHPETKSLEETRNSKSNRWSFIQNDLEKALDTWQELENAEAQLSPEEEQFQKIKTIIGQLKQKLEQF
jgi:hypothetical protein